MGGVASQHATQQMPPRGHFSVNTLGQAKGEGQMQHQCAGKKQRNSLPKNTKRLGTGRHLAKRGDVVHRGLHRLAGDGVALHQLGSLAKRNELNGSKPIEAPE